MPLSTTELRERLAAAEQDEVLALSRLQSLQAASVAAEIEDSAEERQAAAEHRKAKEGVQRLRVALSHTEAAERAHATALRRADEDAQERAASAAFDRLEKDAHALEKTMSAYAKAWDAFGAARLEAQRHVANFRPGVFRPDLKFIEPSRTVRHGLAALSKSVPGREALTWTDNLGAPLRAGDGDLAAEIDSLCRAAREDLDRVRSQRGPLPGPALVAAVDPAADWTV